MLNTTRLSDKLPTLEEAAQYRVVLVLPPDQREVAARALVAQQRREQFPGRRTWEAKDSLLPAPEGLIAVLDNEGDLWRSIPGTGEWREVPRPGPALGQGTNGRLLWSQLLQKFAPVTEPLGEWAQQRADVMGALRSARVELDCLLAHTAVGAVDGTGSRSMLEADEDDDDLLDRAKRWASRLSVVVKSDFSSFVIARSWY
ncbi:hypothetical protein ACFYOI_35740 [Streptomyces microflavus]|uniref:hypothetical protein n=1 Tax=Streptomyces microflavus TaxID=1919 RepID=UPI0033A3A930